MTIDKAGFWLLDVYSVRPTGRMRFFVVVVGINLMLDNFIYITFVLLTLLYCIGRSTEKTSS
jgi:hypothetical protein